MALPTFNPVNEECQKPENLAMVVAAILDKLGMEAHLSYSGDMLVHVHLEQNDG